jgi:Sensors of blue-light using FAD
MIRRIGYVSRPVPGLSLAEIPRIVSICRARNAAAKIRGVLVFTGVEFAQLIEGPPESVVALWLKLHRDPRHCDLVTLFDERAPTPWFTEWRVGFSSDAATVSQIAHWRELPPSRWDDAQRAEMRQLLSSIDAI